MDRWVGKVAVVTGASSGIGEAVVKILVENGLKVAALARRVDRLKKLEKDLANCKGEVIGIACDITKNDEVIKAFAAIQVKWGALHILINNAGVMRSANIQDLSYEDMIALFGTNIIGLCSCIREGVKLMKGISEGHIINISSIAGHYIPPFNGFGAYSATKHGVTVLSECLRREVATMKEKIRVTNISPGLVDTEMAGQILEGNDNVLTALPSSAIGEAIVYAISAPSVVNISEIIIQPAGENMIDLGNLLEKEKQKK